jgi:hypothetical protein
MHTSIQSLFRYVRGILLVAAIGSFSACSDERASLPDSPEFRYVDGRPVVTGCSGVMDENAKGICPMLFCEAAVRKAVQIDKYHEVKFSGGPTSEDGSRWLMVGTATSLRPDRTQIYVQCLIEDGVKIVRAGQISEHEYFGARHNHEGL